MEREREEEREKGRQRRKQKKRLRTEYCLPYSVTDTLFIVCAAQREMNYASLRQNDLRTYSIGKPVINLIIYFLNSSNATGNNWK